MTLALTFDRLGLRGGFAFPFGFRLSTRRRHGHGTRRVSSADCTPRPPASLISVEPGRALVLYVYTAYCYRGSLSVPRAPAAARRRGAAGRGRLELSRFIFQQHQNVSNKEQYTVSITSETVTVSTNSEHALDQQTPLTIITEPFYQSSQQSSSSSSGSSTHGRRAPARTRSLWS